MYSSAVLSYLSVDPDAPHVWPQLPEVGHALPGAHSSRNRESAARVREILRRFLKSQVGQDSKERASHPLRCSRAPP